MDSRESVYEKVEGKYHSPEEVLAYEAKRFASPGGRLLNEMQVSKIIELLGEGPCSVLEAGCGTGRFTFNMARAGHQVTAIDYSPAMLEACRHRHKAEPGAEKVSFQQASVFELPFADQSFDRIISIHVLMHLPDHEKAIAELIRVLKPGGRLIFDIRNSNSLNRVAYPVRRMLQTVSGRKPWYVWYATLGDVEALAAAHGARLVEAVGMFPVKPNRLPSVTIPLLKWMEAAPEGSFLKRAGHIQLVVLQRN